jgi:hypothetical protein
MNPEQPKVETLGKEERREIREKIETLVFNLEQVLKNNLGLSSIRLGEVQSSDFISKAKEIAEDDSLWNSLSEEFTKEFTIHGVKYEKGGNKNDYRKELRELIARHG